MLSMHSILVSVAAGGPLTFDSQLRREGPFPAVPPFFLPVYKPPLRSEKNRRRGSFSHFFRREAGVRGVGVGVYTGFPSFFKYTLVPCFPLLFCYVFRLSEEDER